MRHGSYTLAVGLLALAIMPTSSARAQDSHSPLVASPRPALTRDSAYSSRESDFVVGKRVFLRSTKTFIGVIVDADASHAFPPERFPRARMKAVLIERRDGPRSWVPLEGIGRIYAVR